MNSKDVRFGLERYLAQIRFDVRPLEDGSARFGSCLGREASNARCFCSSCESLRIARSRRQLHRQARGPHPKDPLDASRCRCSDPRCRCATRSALRLERRERVLGPRGGEREVVLEEIVVAVDVRDREDVQAERVVAHEVGQARVGVDDHLVGQALTAVVVQRLESSRRTCRTTSAGSATACRSRPCSRSSRCDRRPRTPAGSSRGRTRRQARDRSQYSSPTSQLAAVLSKSASASGAFRRFVIGMLPVIRECQRG